AIMKWTLGIALTVVMALAQAQDYPAKPIRILVPFAPGGAVDTSTRILTQKMTERLGWNFVVENRPGDNGFIATTAVAKALAAGIKLQHIPYKGGAPAAQAVGAGDVDFGVMAVPGATPFLKSGKGKVIGITTAKKSPLNADWATPRDGGIPDLDASIWVGLFAPKATPHAVVDKMNAEVRRTLGDPEVQKR